MIKIGNCYEVLDVLLLLLISKGENFYRFVIIHFTDFCDRKLEQNIERPRSYIGKQKMLLEKNYFSLDCQATPTVCNWVRICCTNICSHFWIWRIFLQYQIISNISFNFWWKFNMNLMLFFLAIISNVTRRKITYLNIN